MPYGIKGKPAGVFCRVVPKLIGNKAMAKLVEGNADKSGYDGYENAC